MMVHRHIRVRGIVQGVGFRPFIHKLARLHGVRGEVVNDTLGVDIHAEGEEAELDAFIRAIEEDVPPLARIASVQWKEEVLRGYSNFTIGKSRSSEERLAFYSPDMALCPDCLGEFLDPGDRRFRYPFITCINCGPRFSIVTDVPYDRPNTEMVHFPMCPECQEEYDSVENRRFHSQPNACSLCGPQLQIFDSEGNQLDVKPEDVPDRTLEMLDEGMILAVKGIGGYHLVADAHRDDSLKKLRKRKHRPFKPFALMASSLDVIRKYAYISEGEQELLLSPERPILLFRSRGESDMSREVAPGMGTLGFMLPYTPLQYLLFETRPERVLVMTSANISDEPIVFREKDAFRRLGNIADFFVTFNREIAAQSDDSVLMVVEEEPVFVRRSRGYVPAPFFSRNTPARVLAMGGDKKNAFALARKDVVIMSQYLGDMADMLTHRTFRETVKHFIHVFDMEPDLIVADMHPGYMTRLFADEMAEGKISRMDVQHHHAHAVSVMEEENLDGPVIGISYDGTGYGPDGTLWGSEILICDRKDYRRAGHFTEFPLPGGESAIRDVWKIGHSLLLQAFGEVPEEFRTPETGLLLEGLSAGLNAPLSCSIGRIFDGMASLLGITQKVTGEAEAAQLLEERAHLCQYEPGIADIDGLDLQDGVYLADTGELVRSVLTFHGKKGSPEESARFFHDSIIAMTGEIVTALGKDLGLDRVVLTGGVFNNRILLSGITRYLRERGFWVYTNRKVPVNDGGIALGQVAVAREFLSGS